MKCIIFRDLPLMRHHRSTNIYLNSVMRIRLLSAHDTVYFTLSSNAVSPANHNYWADTKSYFPSSMVTCNSGT